MSIDPIKITNYNLSNDDLEENLLFWLFAAGHNALSTAKGLDKFLTVVRKKAAKFGYLDGSPFTAIYTVANYLNWREVVRILGISGLGCWRIKSEGIRQLVFEKNLNLRTCTVEDLEDVHSIGPKTARCFVLHTRKDARVAGLDTHILKFLRDKGIAVPKATPTGNRYKLLEQEFLRLADEAGKTPAELDLEVWNFYREKKNEEISADTLMEKLTEKLDNGSVRSMMK